MSLLAKPARAFLAASLCGLLAWGAQAEGTADPRQTRAALAIFLKAANTPIPKHSTCAGEYGQKGPATLADMLAMRVEDWYNGNNTITGQCLTGKASSCSLAIHHANGEDVSSTEIRFGVAAGKLKIDTLECVMTP